MSSHTYYGNGVNVIKTNSTDTQATSEIAEKVHQINWPHANLHAADRYRVLLLQ